MAENRARHQGMAAIRPRLEKQALQAISPTFQAIFIFAGRKKRAKFKILKFFRPDPRHGSLPGFQEGGNNQAARHNGEAWKMIGINRIGRIKIEDPSEDGIRTRRFELFRKLIPLPTLRF